jgi:DNA-binding MarR family transcriptional regulator
VTQPRRKDLEERLRESLVRMISAAVLVNHEISERLGLGPTDSQFLTLLDVHGPLAPGRLGELSGLTSGAVTAVLGRLEKAGYVRRDPDPEDRRRVVVSRVDAPIAAEVAPLYEAQAEGLRAALRGRSREELELLASFLEALTEESRSRR